MQLTSEEALKKAFGVRENLDTKQVFHLTSNQPPESYKDHQSLALPMGLYGPNGNMAYKVIAQSSPCIFLVVPVVQSLSFVLLCLKQPSKLITGYNSKHFL